MVNEAKQNDQDITSVLGANQPAVKNRWLRWLITAAVVITLLIGVWMIFTPSDAPTQRYETARVQQGDLTVTVAATGTVQPVNQVDVGSELSGTVESVLVDFNDEVQKGQTLARLGTDRLQAQVVEAGAALESAKAKLDEANATVQETRLRYERCKKLADRKLCSGEELATTQAAYARARAQAASAKAQIAVASATLGARETDLSKTEIKSPIDGLVLQRQIEPGQTVAASLQAPVLFTLAEDLKQMELHVAIDEADVGKVSAGQSAMFSVDAYADRRFPARITQVRYAPQTIEGVVTYGTILSVDNSDLALRPGMTATAIVTVAQLKNAILVPNASLRFTPQIKKKVKRSSGLFGALFKRPRKSKTRTNTSDTNQQKVWIVENGQPKALSIKTGASDGKFTEVRSGDVRPGQEVIIDAVTIKK